MGTIETDFEKRTRNIQAKFLRRTGFLRKYAAIMPSVFCGRERTSVFICFIIENAFYFIVQRELYIIYVACFPYKQAWQSLGDLLFSRTSWLCYEPCGS